MKRDRARERAGRAAAAGRRYGSSPVARSGYPAALALPLDETTEWLRVPAAAPRDQKGQAYWMQRAIARGAGAPDRLEEAAIELAILQGTDRPSVEAVRILVLAADHGCGADVASRQSPTSELVGSIARGSAGMGKLARELAARLEVIDLGIATDPGPLPDLICMRIGPGAADFCEGPSMTRHQLARAMHAGRHAAERARLAGTELLVGETVGIGSLGSAEALACALLAVSPDGLVASDRPREDPGLESIRRGLAHHRQHLRGPLEALRRLGGYGLAALTGSYMACSHMGVPVLVDGFVSSVAALAAARLCRGAERWFLYARGPRHRGHQLVLEALSARPLLEEALRRQDGAGAAAAILQLRRACSLKGEESRSAASAGAG